MFNVRSPFILGGCPWYGGQRTRWVHC